MSDVTAHRDWLLSYISVPPGGAVVDLGSGDGSDLRALAEQFADPDARFLGVDASESKIDSARAATSDGRITFRHDRIGETLPFDDGAFDVALTQELLECLPKVDAFVEELGRVMGPGGLLVASHYDWDTQVFSGSNRALTRRMIQGWADWEQSWMEHADPWMGRRLWGHLQGSRLFDGAVHVRAMTNTVFAEPWHGFRLAQGFRGLVKRGVVSAGEYETFVTELRNLSEQGRYFWSVNRYVYVGRRTGR
ncbi:MAG: methyltransferase domain-containing protein [Gemmatimonadota bacterium]